MDDKKQLLKLALDNQFKRIAALECKVKQAVNDLTDYIYSFEYIKKELGAEIEFTGACEYLNRSLKDLIKKINQIPSVYIMQQAPNRPAAHDVELVKN